jgi:hypothetical protein
MSSGFEPSSLIDPASDGARPLRRELASCQVLALSGGPSRRSNSVAVGAIADIGPKVGTGRRLAQYPGGKSHA